MKTPVFFCPISKNVFVFQEEKSFEIDKKIICGDLERTKDGGEVIDEVMVHDLNTTDYKELHVVASNTVTDSKIQAQHQSKLQGVRFKN